MIYVVIYFGKQISKYVVWFRLLLLVFVLLIIWR